MIWIEFGMADMDWGQGDMDGVVVMDGDKVGRYECCGGYGIFFKIAGGIEIEGARLLINYRTSCIVLKTKLREPFENVQKLLFIFTGRCFNVS